MGPPKFGLSTYGWTIIIDEGILPGSSIDPMRVVFLILTGLMSVSVSSLVYSHYKRILSASKNSSRRSSSSTSGLPFVLLLAFIFSNTFRGSHLFDHMYRPVYYHEPKWVYTKYIFTTVEVPLYIDVPIEIFGLFGMKQLINDLASSTKKMSVSAAIQLILYGAMSAISLIHYTVEPPSNYGIAANFTISGTVITAIGFILLVVYGWFVLGNAETKSKKSTGDGSDEVKLLQKEGAGTRSAAKTNPSARRRSQTPKRDNQ